MVNSYSPLRVTKRYAQNVVSKEGCRREHRGHKQIEVHLSKEPTRRQEIMLQSLL